MSRKRKAGAPDEAHISSLEQGLPKRVKPSGTASAKSSSSSVKHVETAILLKTRSSKRVRARSRRHSPVSEQPEQATATTSTAAPPELAQLKISGYGTTSHSPDPDLGEPPGDLNKRGRKRWRQQQRKAFFHPGRASKDDGPLHQDSQNLTSIREARMLLLRQAASTQLMTQPAKHWVDVDAVAEVASRQGEVHSDQHVPCPAQVQLRSSPHNLSSTSVADDSSRSEAHARSPPNHALRSTSASRETRTTRVVRSPYFSPSSKKNAKPVSAAHIISRLPIASRKITVPRSWTGLRVVKGASDARKAFDSFSRFLGDDRESSTGTESDSHDDNEDVETDSVPPLPSIENRTDISKALHNRKEHLADVCETATDGSQATARDNSDCHTIETAHSGLLELASEAASPTTRRVSSEWAANIGRKRKSSARDQICGRRQLSVSDDADIVVRSSDPIALSVDGEFDAEPKSLPARVQYTGDGTASIHSIEDVLAVNHDMDSWHFSCAVGPRSSLATNGAMEQVTASLPITVNDPTSRVLLRSSSVSSLGPEGRNEEHDLFSVIDEVSKSVFEATRALPSGELDNDKSRFDEHALTSMYSTTSIVRASHEHGRERGLRLGSPAPIRLSCTPHPARDSPQPGSPALEHVDVASELRPDTMESKDVDHLDIPTAGSIWAEVSVPDTISYAVYLCPADKHQIQPRISRVEPNTWLADSKPERRRRSARVAGTTSKYFAPMRSISHKISAISVVLGQNVFDYDDSVEEKIIAAHTAIPGVPTTITRENKRRVTGKTSEFFLSPHLDRVDTQKPKGQQVPRGISTARAPSTSAQHFGIVQEKLWDQPFWLLISAIFLCQTKGQAAVPTFWQVKERWSTPEELANADQQEVMEMIRHLGLQLIKSARIIKVAKVWIVQPPKVGYRYRTLNYPNRGSHRTHQDGMDEDVEDCVGGLEIGHIPGLGRYAWDSWRIFCRDVMRGVAEDYNGKGARDELFAPEWQRVLPDDKELRATVRWMWLREGWIWSHDTGAKRKATDAELKSALAGGPSEFECLLRESTSAASQEISEVRKSPVVPQRASSGIGSHVDSMGSACDREDSGIKMTCEPDESRCVVNLHVHSESVKDGLSPKSPIARESETVPPTTFTDTDRHDAA